MEAKRLQKRTTDHIPSDTAASASSAMPSHSAKRPESLHMKASHLVSTLISTLGGNDSNSSKCSTSRVAAGQISRASSANISPPDGSFKSISSCQHVDHSPSGALQQHTDLPFSSWAGTCSNSAATISAVAGITDPGATCPHRSCETNAASRTILADTVFTPEGPSTSAYQHKHSSGRNSVPYLPDHVFLLDDPEEADCSPVQEAQNVPSKSSNNNTTPWQGAQARESVDAIGPNSNYKGSHSTPLPMLDFIGTSSISADGLNPRPSNFPGALSAALPKLTISIDSRITPGRHEPESPASQALHYKQNHGYLPSPTSSTAGQSAKGFKDGQLVTEASRLSNTCSLLTIPTGLAGPLSLPPLQPGSVPQFGAAAMNSSTNNASPAGSASAIAAAASDAWQPLNLTSAQLSAGSVTLQESAPGSTTHMGSFGRIKSGRTTPVHPVSCSGMRQHVTQQQCDPEQHQHPQQQSTVLDAPTPVITLAPENTQESVLLAVSPRLPPFLQRSRWCLADFVKHKKLYDGYASTIYKAMDRPSGQIVALKLYHMDKLNSISSHQVAREVRLHMGVSHDNVIGLHAAFQEAGDVVLVQEYASGGDLWSFIDANSGRLSERMTVSLVLQPFLRALQYLHYSGIVHRDIKPENVLFSGDMVLKIADFGLALNLREERAVTRVGTLDYMAPEVLRCPLKRNPGDNKNKSELQYSEAVDSWAVGVLAYELLTGRAPFSASGASDAAIEAAIQSTAPTFPSRMSEPAVEFITLALHKNPSKRPSILQLLQHPWIRSFKRSTSHDRVDSLSDPGTTNAHKLHQPFMLQQLLAKKELSGHDDSCMTGYASGTR